MVQRASVGGLLLLLLLILGYTCFKERTWLSISEGANQGKKMLYVAPLPEGSKFCIRFKHSVALTPVEEWFVAKKGMVSLQSTVYEDFGAGLPHDVDAAAGQKMTVSGGKVFITGYTLNLHSLYVRVGRVAEHELVVETENGVRENSLRLDTLAKPGAALKVSILTNSLAHILWRYWNILAV